MQRGINSDGIKERNRGLILKLLCSQNVKSRIEMSKITGLTKMAISNIINGLIDDNYVKETELTVTTNVGRNPMGLMLSEKSPLIMGVYISREKLVGVLCDLCGVCVDKSEISLNDETNQTLVDKVLKVTHKLNKKAKERSLIGIGVASIGPVDAQNGIILNPLNFYEIKNFDIKTLLTTEFNLPVYIDNDMNAAALAEVLFSDNNYTEFMYIGITNGVGAGIVTGSKLYQNNSSFAGEIGHVGVEINGELCHCGNRGCLEKYISIPVITNKISAVLGREIKLNEIKKMHKDEKIKIIFDDVFDKLSFALTNAVNFINPDAIIIGHEGVYLPNEYIQKLQEDINCRIFNKSNKSIQVMKSKFGLTAPIIGSTCCVINKVFEGKEYK